MAAPTLDQLIREFRRVVLALDVDVARRLVAAHRAEMRRLGPQLADLVGLLRRAGAIDDAERWIRDTEAATRLTAAAEAGMAEFGEYAARVIEHRRQELIRLAREHEQALTYASLVGNAQVTPATSLAIRAALTAIPVEAVTSVVGALQPSSPLRALFDEFGSVASRRLGETLVDGITRGQGAAELGRRLRHDLDGNATRALTTARTETHRAYRSAHLDAWAAKPKLYAGWTWQANLDKRTCPVCIAKHGTVHTLDEQFGGHPCCRCRPLPLMRDDALVELLGDTPDARELQERINAQRTRRQTGTEWFRRQPVLDQLDIVGPLKYRAIVRGQITLDDIPVERVDPVWGLGHRTGSLAEAIANANARRAA